MERMIPVANGKCQTPEGSVLVLIAEVLSAGHSVHDMPPAAPL